MALLATMQRFNAACDWVAERAFERKLANRYALYTITIMPCASSLICPRKWPV